MDIVYSNLPNLTHSFPYFSYVLPQNHFGDFAKPGVESANPESRKWVPKLLSAFKGTTGGTEGRGDTAACRFVFQFAMANATAHTLYGAPEVIDVEVVVGGDKTKDDTSHTSMDDAFEPISSVSLSLTWVNKTATRLPESMWMSFVPVVNKQGEEAKETTGASWEMDVMGYPVNPLDVVERGTRWKHVVQDRGGVTLDDGRCLNRV